MHEEVANGTVPEGAQEHAIWAFRCEVDLTRLGR
jgi:hypothetical protein